MNEAIDLVVALWSSSTPFLRGLMIIGAGWLAALVLRALIRGGLALFRFDHFAERVGLTAFLRNGQVTQRPARLVSGFLYQLALLITFLVASRALDIAAVNAITDRLVESLPAMLAAVFITVIGIAVVGFLCNVIEAILRNTPLTNVRTVVNAFRYIGFAVILLMASDQLGFGKSLLSTLLLIAFAGVTLAFAIAFGLGSADAARRAMENLAKNLNERAKADTEPERED